MAAELHPKVAEKYKLVKAKADTSCANSQLGTFRIADLTVEQADALVQSGFVHLALHDKKQSEPKIG